MKFSSFFFCGQNGVNVLICRWECKILLFCIILYVCKSHPNHFSLSHIFFCKNINSQGYYYSSHFFHHFQWTSYLLFIFIYIELRRNTSLILGLLLYIVGLFCVTIFFSVLKNLECVLIIKLCLNVSLFL